MAKAISNTSPLLSLYRIEAIGRLSQLFEEVWIPTAVVKELSEGRQRDTTYLILAVITGSGCLILRLCLQNGYLSI